ncbi:hypothetical protein LWC33_09515 [Pseudonocardia sp. RS11V-5]|uniref:hypothetical protein n=1 Tax=Pseudonocardia terrae TaxID=2905831 RepID=UPI001E40793F|nr:hypothetical protein [Pseudonocardia terrae]MCE3551691.1 hypothetical protein [Pseudonocardia terrae]
MGEWNGSRDPRPAADRRDVAACARDDAAELRDHASHERDAEADRRDGRAGTRDVQAAGRVQGVLTRLWEIRRDLLESMDRLASAEQACDDGTGPSRSAEHAAAWRRDRNKVDVLLDEAIALVAHSEFAWQEAAGDRRASARDRTAAAQDRQDSAVDREGSAADREQAAVDREQVDARTEAEAEAAAARRGSVAAHACMVEVTTAVARAVRGSEEQIAQSRAVLTRTQQRSRGRRR